MRAINTAKEISKEKEKLKNLKLLDAKSVRKETICNILIEEGRLKIIYDYDEQGYVKLLVINPIGRRRVNVDLYQNDSITTIGIIGNAPYTGGHTYKTNYQRTLKRYFQNLALEYIAGKAKLKNLSESGLQDPNIPFFGYRIANKDSLDRNLVTRVYDVALEYHERINSPKYGSILKYNMGAIDRRQKISVVELFL